MTRSYKTALRECKRVGTAHASGDGLRAMYAGLVALQHGGSAEDYYAYLPQGSDMEIAEAARELLRDRAQAYDVLMGVKS